jgi:hypothetical protein
MTAIYGTSADASAQDPPTQAAAVTPSDTVDLTYATTRVWIGGAGDIQVTFADNAAATVIAAVPVGTMLPIRVRRIWSTNTTATNIVALWR